MITTYCYGKRIDFETIKDAILYYVDGINHCDNGSSECSRYVDIIKQLKLGNSVVTDGSVAI